MVSVVVDGLCQCVKRVNYLHNKRIKCSLMPLRNQRPTSNNNIDCNVIAKMIKTKAFVTQNLKTILQAVWFQVDITTHLYISKYKSDHSRHHLCH